MEAAFYNSTAWRRLRTEARQRDDNRCTVQRLLGGACHGIPHVHHIDPDADPLDLDNLSTVCATHHPKWEALRRALLEERPAWRVCPHRHPTREGRLACERRLNAGLLSA